MYCCPVLYFAGGQLPSDAASALTPSPFLRVCCRYHALRQRRLQAAASRFTHSTMCKAWAAWRCHAQHKQSNAAKLQAAAGLWAGNTLALCWHRWRALVASVRQCRAASGAAAALYRLQLQRRALLTLWLNRLCRCEQRFVAFQAIGHMQGFRRAALKGWARWQECRAFLDCRASTLS